MTGGLSSLTGSEDQTVLMTVMINTVWMAMASRKLTTPEFGISMFKGAGHAAPLRN